MQAYADILNLYGQPKYITRRYASRSITNQETNHICIYNAFMFDYVQKLAYQATEENCASAADQSKYKSTRTLVQEKLSHNYISVVS